MASVDHQPQFCLVSKRFNHLWNKPLCLPFPCPEATASPLCPNRPFIFWRRPRSLLKGIHSFSTSHSQKVAVSYMCGSHCPACGSKHLSAPRMGGLSRCQTSCLPGRQGSRCQSRARAAAQAIHPQTSALRELCRPRSSFTAKPCFLQSTGSRTCLPKSRQWMVTREGLCAASPLAPEHHGGSWK